MASGLSPFARVLPFATADGPTNMALDEALLELAAPGVAVVRAYAWSVPTLSLGYFQSWDAPPIQERFRDSAIVRRPTGGGALWHHHEITYALVLPRDHPLSHRHTDLYQAVHERLARGLRALGAQAGLRGHVDHTGPRPFLCFRDQDTADVVIEEQKVIGSAQRRRAGAVLQHGSLLLRHSPSTPELVGLTDLAPRHSEGLDWAAWLADRVISAIALDPRPSTLTRDERDRAAELIAKHTGAAWTHRRVST